MKHLCVLNQPRVSKGVTELLPLKAEPGHTYYIRIRNWTWVGNYMEVAETNEGQGTYMVSVSPLAQSKAKK